MSKVTIFHNPRCSKSRQTMQILEERGAQVQTVEYLKNPPSAEELKRVLKLLGLSARALMRKHEEPYKTLNLDNDALSEDQLITAMVENPVLIERPIVIANDKAVIGRPPERIIEIL